MAYASVEKIILPLFARSLRRSVGIENIPQKPPYILAANHIDYLDGFYIAAAVEQARKHTVYFITKSKNYWWTQTTIPINATSGTSSLEIATRHLRSGRVICNFIEGQRNSSQSLLPARTGTARLALTAEVPVIPVGIDGPIGKNFAHSVTNVLTERKSVELSFGTPVQLDDLRGRSDVAAVREASLRIMRALSKLTGKDYIS